jgi:hypothetical protein
MLPLLRLLLLLLLRPPTRRQRPNRALADLSDLIRHDEFPRGISRVPLPRGRDDRVGSDEEGSGVDIEAVRTLSLPILQNKPEC